MDLGFIKIKLLSDYAQALIWQACWYQGKFCREENWSMIG